MIILLEVLITLGLAFGGYELAVWLHVSAPIMAVCAGLLIGDIGSKTMACQKKPANTLKRSGSW